MSTQSDFDREAMLRAFWHAGAGVYHAGGMDFPAIKSGDGDHWVYTLQPWRHATGKAFDRARILLVDGPRAGTVVA